MTGEQFVQTGLVVDLPMPTLSLGAHLLDSIRKRGDRAAQIFPATGEKVTNADILERSVSVALELKLRGVRANDIVVILSKNCPEYTCILLGTLYLGAIIAPLNPAFDTVDLQNLLDVMQPRVVFAEAFLEENLKEVLDSSVELVLLGQDSSWDSFLQHRDSEDTAAFQALSKVNVEEDTALIMCSSGTTGLPKAVQLTHSNMHSLLLTVRGFKEFVDRPEVVVSVSPGFWVSGFLNYVMSLDMGTTLVLLPAFEVDLVLDTIQKYKASMFTLGPGQVVEIAKSESVEQYDISCLRLLGYAGAPLGPGMRALAEQRLKMKMTQIYGMTEAMFVLIPGPLATEKPDSCGILAPNMSAKILDLESGKPVGPNQEGELCVKGPTLMKGYYHNSKATLESIDSDGWMHTGDIGHYDEDGYFYIYDRIKELIKYRGIHIAPCLLESVLLSHPGVKDTAVVGVHHDLDQERAVGFVVRQPDSDVTEEELIKLMEDKISQHKWLHGGVKFVETIPRTASGKVQRRDLRRYYNTICNDIHYNSS